jgi:hypothetical protein
MSLQNTVYVLIYLLTDLERLTIYSTAWDSQTRKESSTSRLCKEVLLPHTTQGLLLVASGLERSPIIMDVSQAVVVVS